MMMGHDLPFSEDAPSISTNGRQLLLEWFATAARDLPWRRTRDPYRILVSEVMLQQTQVDRVIPRYEEFLALFPSLEALAAAPTSEVIKCWSGLGYNRRAVNLQRAAQAVLSEHGGVFPRDVAGLRRLPGVGAYTAGALACFAFEQDVFFMDTNIRRVVQRWQVGNARRLSESELQKLGEQLVPAGHGWAWNQALMELGALICSSAKPQCWRCPLRNECRAYAERRQADATVFDEPPSRQPLRRVAESGARGETFVGSRRYYRGRIVAALRDLAAGECLAVDALGSRIKADYSSQERAWLEALLAGLLRDGLIAYSDDEVSLP